MNTNKIFLYIATTCLLMTACAEEIQQDKSELRIPLNLEAVPQAAITRTSTDTQNTLFDANEDINAYFTVTVDGSASALISEKDNTLTTAANPVVLKTGAASNGVNALSPKDGSTLYFPPGDNDKVNVEIYALYPSTVTSSLTSFEVQKPQTTEAHYKASDLMYASATSPKTDQTIHLQFDHKMAKLIINATGEENLTMKKITLKSLYTTISWDAPTGTLGSTSGSKTDIVIADNSSFASSLTGVALFPPQTKDDTYFMEVVCQDPTDNNSQKTAYFSICTKDFEEGKSYIINVKIGPRNLKSDGVVLIDPWPETVGTINIQSVGNLGLSITSLSDDGEEDTNSMQGSGLEGYYTYNGKNCTPVPTVTDGKTKDDGKTPADDAKYLTKGTDYDVKYYNNLNAGTALVVVTGKGDYEGISTFATFTINRAANTMSYPNSNAAFESNLSKNAIVQNALVRPSFQTNEVYGQMTYGLYSDAACTTPYTGDIATIDANGNVFMQKKGGPIYVKASMDDTGNFEAASCSYELTITAGDVSKTISVVWTDGKADGEETWPFTGTAITPAFTITDNGNTLVGAQTNGTNYNYSFSNNVNVGNNTAVLTITGQGEYTGTKTFYFSITKVDNSWTTLNQPSVPIDCGDSKSNPQGDQNVTLSIAAGTFAIAGVPKFGTGTNSTGLATNVTYSSDKTGVATVSNTGVITGVSAGTAKITATVAGTTNYNTLTTVIDVTVEKMTQIFVYNGKTEKIGSGSSPSAAVPSSATYWCQVREGTVQTCNMTFAANATVYALLVGAGGGCDGSAGWGGAGGYVYATKTYNKGSSETLYVWCGGGGYSDCQGTNSTTAAISSPTTDNLNSYLRQYGAWYDGGHPGHTGCSGAGGGPTVVASTNSTSGWTFNSNDTRLLVAGAGGGASNGGNAGESGNDPGNKVGTMKECTSGRLKWMGGRCATSGEIQGLGDFTTDGGGGGAGYYGGLGGLESNVSGTDATGGHGGSNFIADGTYDANINKNWVKKSSGVSSDQTFNDIGFTMSYNGHGNTAATNTHLIRCYPGYVIIKYKYDR